MGRKNSIISLKITLYESNDPATRKPTNFDRDDGNVHGSRGRCAGAAIQSSDYFCDGLGPGGKFLRKSAGTQTDIRTFPRREACLVPGIGAWAAACRVGRGSGYSA